MIKYEKFLLLFQIIMWVLLTYSPKVFDMIVGASVGGILSLALVGGREDPETGMRIAKPIQELLDEWDGIVKRIFEKKLEDLTVIERWSDWLTIKGLL